MNELQCDDLFVPTSFLLLPPQPEPRRERRVEDFIQNIRGAAAASLGECVEGNWVAAVLDV